MGKKPKSPKLDLPSAEKDAADRLKAAEAERKRLLMRRGSGANVKAAAMNAFGSGATSSGGQRSSFG